MYRRSYRLERCSYELGSYALATLVAVASGVTTLASAAAPGGNAPRHQSSSIKGATIGRLPGTPRSGSQGANEGRPSADGGIASACGTLSFTQSASSAITPLNTAECFDDTPVGIATAENGLARSFTAPQSLHIRCVTFGIQENDGGAWPVQARIWFGGSVVASSDPVEIPADSGPALYTATIPDFFAIPAGSDFVVELLVPSRRPADGGDGGALFLASNALGQSAPTFIRAPFCQVNSFTNLADFGFPNTHLVMTVEADVPQTSVQTFGFEHTASGDIVERKDANGKVTIWHAAAPSAGSVSIELGVLSGPMGFAMEGSFATGSPDSTITWSPIAGFDGLPEGPVGTTRFHTGDGTHGTIQVDYSMLGTAAQTVRLFDADGNPIADFAWGNDMPIGVGAPPEGFAYSCRAYEEIDIKWPVPVPVTLGAVTIDAGSMRIAVKAPAFTPTYLSAFVLTSEIASSVSPAALEITAERIDQFGVALSTGNDGTFVNAAITPVGTTGVTFGSGSGAAVLVAKEYDKSTPKLIEKCVKTLEVELDPQSLDQPDLTLTATVSDSSDFDGTPNASSLELIHRDAFFDIWNDFSGIGSDTYIVEIYLNHIPMAAFPGLTGQVGSMSIAPKKIGKLGGQSECFVMCTDNPAFFTVGGQVVLGDEIRILAEGGAAAECKDLLTLSATNAPGGVTVTGASSALKLPPWIVKFGNSHAAVGSSIVACDDVLYAWHDLGDPGLSGVAMNVPGADGASMTFELPTGSVDAEHRVRTLSENGVSDESLSLKVQPGHIVSVTLDIQAPSAATIHAIRDGQTVFSMPTVLPPVPIEIASLNLTGLDTVIAKAHPVWAAKECKDEVSLNVAVPMSFAPIGGGTVLADTLLVVRATDNPPNLGSVSLTGNACTPTSVILAESIDALGWTMSGLGHAHLDTSIPGAVSVTAAPIGVQGEDGGMVIDLGCAASFDISVDSPEWTTPNGGVGGFLQLEGVAGEFAGEPGGGSTGTLTIFRPDSFFDVFTDFDALGTELKHIRVLDDAGIPVFQTITSSDFIGQLTSAPFKLGKLGGATPCYRACVPPGTLFTLGAVTVPAHEVQILAVGGNDAACKAAAQLTLGDGLGEFVVTNIVTQPACLGDLDADGQVSGPDLAILLGAWATAGADLDGDGTTNAADLAILLGAWGPC